MRFFLSLLLLICFAASTALGAAKTKVKLLLSVETARAGDTVLAGIQMTMPPKWHTYWTNSGDAGSATEIQWTLPEGITAGEVQWPVPEKYVATAEDLRLTTYVYHDEVLLLVPLKLAADLPHGDVKLSARVDWQECEEICILGKATVNAALTIGAENKPSPNASRFEEWKTKLPKKEPAFPVVSTWSKIEEASRLVTLEFAVPGPATNWDFFPYPSKAFDIKGDTEWLAAEAGKIRLQKKVEKLEGDWPKEMAGLLVNVNASFEGYEIRAPIAAPAGEAAPTSFEPASLSLPLALLFAFIGGLILNFMPCVLPVISLKVFSFVNQSRETPGRVRLLGLLYGLGVIVSFVALATVAILAKKAGDIATWGMLLQDRQFSVALTVLITLVALNLFGVFEVTLSGRVMGTAGNLASREGTGGAFLNGVLATILATPCTAPFLAPALGFAFTQPPAIILLIFVMVGLGLAAPFVILCFQPGWLKVLPRPGAWMEKFKIAMGFPMLATAMWLFWFTAPRFGKSGVLWLGLFLVVLAAAVWVWGEFVQRGRQRKGLAIFISLFLLLGMYAYALEGKLHWRSAAKAPVSSGSLKESPDGIDWQPWSPEAVETARNEGHPVLVDFTADNCLNCQLNKASSLEIPATRAMLKEMGVVALLGDFTEKDPRIAAELQRYGRPGVPLVLVYPREKSAEPIVLPPLLTPGIVREALEKAAR